MLVHQWIALPAAIAAFLALGLAVVAGWSPTRRRCLLPTLALAFALERLITVVPALHQGVA